MQIVYRALLASISFMPRSFLRRIAARYIAGDRVDQALEAVKTLHASGMLTTVDLLGENLADAADVEAATVEYERLLDCLAEAGLSSSQISVKPTLMGLRIGEEVARRHLARLVRRAAEYGLSVCIDMEESSTTDATLRLYRSLRQDHDNVWVALQAYLRRSHEDLVSLLPFKPWVRVCKGVYREGAEIALQDRLAIRASFVDLVRLLVEGGGCPAVATHDPWLVDECLSLLEARSIPRSRYEFEMLLGVGDGLRPRILSRGAPLRIYCPYGSDWLGYSIRRLRDNPQWVGHIVKSLVFR